MYYAYPCKTATTAIAECIGMWHYKTTPGAKAYRISNQQNEFFAFRIMQWTAATHFNKKATVSASNEMHF